MNSFRSIQFEKLYTFDTQAWNLKPEINRSATRVRKYLGLPAGSI